MCFIQLFYGSTPLICQTYHYFFQVTTTQRCTYGNPLHSPHPLFLPQFASHRDGGGFPPGTSRCFYGCLFMQHVVNYSVITLPLGYIWHPLNAACVVLVKLYDYTLANSADQQCLYSTLGGRFAWIVLHLCSMTKLHLQPTSVQSILMNVFICLSVWVLFRLKLLKR